MSGEEEKRLSPPGDIKELLGRIVFDAKISLANEAVVAGEDLNAAQSMLGDDPEGRRTEMIRRFADRCETADDRRFARALTDIDDLKRNAQETTSEVERAGALADAILNAGGDLGVRFPDDPEERLRTVMELYGVRVGEEVVRERLVIEPVEEEVEEVPNGEPAFEEEVVEKARRASLDWPGTLGGHYSEKLRLEFAGALVLAGNNLAEIGSVEIPGKDKPEDLTKLQASFEGEGTGRRATEDTLAYAACELTPRILVLAHSVRSNTTPNAERNAAFAANARGVIDGDGKVFLPKDASVVFVTKTIRDEERGDVSVEERTFAHDESLGRQVREYDEIVEGDAGETGRLDWKWQGYTPPEGDDIQLPDYSDWSGRPNFGLVLSNEHGEGSEYVAYAWQQFNTVLAAADKEGIAGSFPLTPDRIVQGMQSVKSSTIRTAIDKGYIVVEEGKVARTTDVPVLEEKHVAPLYWWKDTGQGKKVGGNVEGTMIRLANEDFEPGMERHGQWVAQIQQMQAEES